MATSNQYKLSDNLEANIKMNLDALAQDKILNPFEYINKYQALDKDRFKDPNILGRIFSDRDAPMPLDRDAFTPSAKKWLDQQVKNNADWLKAKSEKTQQSSKMTPFQFFPITEEKLKKLESEFASWDRELISSFTNPSWDDIWNEEKVRMKAAGVGDESTIEKLLAVRQQKMLDAFRFRVVSQLAVDVREKNYPEHYQEENLNKLLAIKKQELKVLQQESPQSDKEKNILKDIIKEIDAALIALKKTDIYKLESSINAANAELEILKNVVAERGEKNKEVSFSDLNKKSLKKVENQIEPAKRRIESGAKAEDELNNIMKSGPFIKYEEAFGIDSKLRETIGLDLKKAEKEFNESFNRDLKALADNIRQGKLDDAGKKDELKAATDTFEKKYKNVLQNSGIYKERYEMKIDVAMMDSYMARKGAGKDVNVMNNLRKGAADIISKAQEENRKLTVKELHDIQSLYNKANKDRSFGINPGVTWRQIESRIKNNEFGIKISAITNEEREKEKEEKRLPKQEKAIEPVQDNSKVNTTNLNFAERIGGIQQNYQHQHDSNSASATMNSQTEFAVVGRPRTGPNTSTSRGALSLLELAEAKQNADANKNSANASPAKTNPVDKSMNLTTDPKNTPNKFKAK